MTYSYDFTFGVRSTKTAKIFSDTLSQFFDDERISFECYFESKEDGLWFFGSYGTDDKALLRKDAKVFKAMMDYAYIFDLPEDGTVTIDSRIQLASLQEFEDSIDHDEDESTEDGMDMMSEILSDETEQNEADEKTNSSECATVTFAPSMLENVDGDKINDIAGCLLEKSNHGEKMFVIDEEAVESGDALKMLVMPGMLKAMKR